MKRTENKTNILIIKAERFPDTWEYYNFGKYKLNKKELLKWFSDNEEAVGNKWWIMSNDYEWLSLENIDLASEFDKLL
jgi:hypothetical protein